MWLGSPLGNQDQDSIIAYFVAHPDEVTQQGVMDFANQYGYTIAAIGGAMGYTAEESAAMMGITVAQATDQDAVNDAIMASIEADRAALLTADVNYAMQHPEAISGEQLTALIATAGAANATAQADAAALDSASIYQPPPITVSVQPVYVESAPASVGVQPEPTPVQITQQYFADHPDESNPAGVRAYMAKTGYSLQVMADAAGTNLDYATTWITSDMAQTDNGQVIDTNVVPIQPAEITKTITDYFVANPEKITPAGITDFMKNTGYTIAQVAAAANMTVTEATNWLNVPGTGTVTDSPPPAPSAGAWMVYLPLAVAVFNFLS